MLKFLVRLAAVVILLPIIAVLVFFFIINPNRYRDSLQAIAFDQTGLQITIAGDISWTFRPTGRQRPQRTGIHPPDLTPCSPARPATRESGTARNAYRWFARQLVY